MQSTWEPPALAGMSPASAKQAATKRKRLVHSSMETPSDVSIDLLLVCWSCFSWRRPFASFLARTARLQVWRVMAAALQTRVMMAAMLKGVWWNSQCSWNMIIISSQSLCGWLGLSRELFTSTDSNVKNASEQMSWFSCWFSGADAPFVFNLSRATPRNAKCVSSSTRRDSGFHTTTR